MLTEEESRPAPIAKLPPAIVLLVGPPGTGKTTFARALQQRTGIGIVESDAVRRSMFSAPDYTKAESGQVFEAVHKTAEARLSRGEGVIVDATNLIENERVVMCGIAARLGARCVVVRLTAPEAVVRQRLGARSIVSGASQAGVEVYEQMRRIRQPILRPHFVVDTAVGIEAAVEAVAREIEAR